MKGHSASRDKAAAATDAAGVDRVVERLRQRKDDWVRTGVDERIDTLRRCIDGLLSVSESWVRESCRHKGIDAGSALAGEAWLSGPMVTIEALQQYVRALRAGGQPRPRRVRQLESGQTVADVFPQSLSERFLYHGMAAEVWIEPGREPTQGRVYREKSEGRVEPGRVALVLGAGNISSIGPLDLMYKLLVEDQVVILKMHPVNAYLSELFEKALEPLIAAGFVAVVRGGRDTGEYLCRHEGVDTIHLTGSDRTHDAIVWGSSPDEQAARKAAGTPVTDKPVTSELGCVTPVLVVPGDWSRRDVEFQAAHVAGMVAHNTSFNCTSGQVLLLARHWPAREAFLEALHAKLARTPPRRAYYPGALDRYARFVARYPQSVVVGKRQPDAVPWTMIPDVPARAGELALSEEAFCGVLAEVNLDAATAPEFLSEAVPFCNDVIWGTLSCTMLVDGTTRRRHLRDVEHAIAALRYGSIGVNVWSGVNYGVSATSWGAFPGHTPENIESGTGVVHNALMFDHPQKSVVRSRFRIRPKPIWFADHRTLDVLGRELTSFAARRSPWHLLRVAVAGLRG